MDQTERVLGVVFDLTLQHHEKKRLVDLVKDQLVRYVREHFDDDDLFYLYHPEVTETLYRRGEQVSAISNYETDGWKFDLEYALKQTLYVVTAEDVDYHKLICVISNRDRNVDHLFKKALVLNQKDDCGCSFLHIAMGSASASKLEDSRFTSVYLDDPDLIMSVIKETEYGRPDGLYCESESIA